jgi:hypothetical protein
MMHTHRFAHRRRTTHQRGVALLLVFMVTIVFFILIGSMLEILAMESHAVASSAESNQALTAAYAGVDAQILAIERFYVNGTNAGTPPDADTLIFPNESGQSLDTGYNAQITKTYSDVHSGIRFYLITSTGFVQDAGGLHDVKLSRQVSALVRQVPFSQYSQFSNSEISTTGSTVWYSNPQSFQGLVYSGGTMHIRYTPGATGAIFQAGFVTASNRVVWQNALTGSPADPCKPLTPDCSDVFAGGTPTYQTSITQDLPGSTQNLVVFSEALFGNSDHNDVTDLNDQSGRAPGVYVNDQMPSGGSGGNLQTGLYIQGNTEMSSTATGNTETFNFKGDGTPNFPQTTVTVDFGADMTTITEGGSTTQYDGVPSAEPGNGSNGNGAIFDNGSMTIDDGSTIHGQYNIALPDPPTGAGQVMTLQGSLTYENDPQKGATNSTDELALWANDIEMHDKTDPNPEVDGMILTGYVNEADKGAGADGAFFNNMCTRLACGGAEGNIVLYGGMIENIRGELGALNSSGLLSGGFMRSAIYDSRLGANPPPFSPTTNDYFVVALTDNGSP